MVSLANCFIENEFVSLVVSPIPLLSKTITLLLDETSFSMKIGSHEFVGWPELVISNMVLLLSLSHIL